ncbi:uncharacterized MFS-type transporter C09D4.1-like [Anoplophora glabripennis]|uniref:uncharacterized MFS-type transporter C09D4.1-like n=1 Tax=Anoplophora glabripennis TaxID=217634 RepID=UPI0008748F8A|nr:uncharacterized MFS-type transporter C09D4.1-like [Anoplophora glabripennis]
MGTVKMVPAESNDLIEKQSVPVKAYKRRWVILVIFILYSAANSFQWMEYSIITSIVKRYYNVSSLAVDWTSIIYMAIYPIIVVPVSYVIDKKGLRVAALVGGLGTALAAAVKVFSIGTDLFYVVLIGQAIGSAAQVFILCLPAKIAAVWFKPSEASTTCSIAVFGTQLGFALGFVFPTSIVKNHEELSLIASNLRQLCWSLTLYMIPVATAIIFYFPRRPPLPPSVPQAEERKKQPPTFNEFLNLFLKLLKKYGFITHMVAYGINIGVFAAVGTFLNQFILQYFPKCEEDAGRMGLLMVVCGMIGSILFGIYLDKTHKYKETTLFIYYMSAVSVAAFMVALKLKSKILAYVTAGTVGFFTNAYMPVGFEFAVELTFPSDESTTTGLLNAMTQALGVVLTLVLGKLNQHFGPLWALGSQAAILLVGAFLTQAVPNEKNRQIAFETNESRKQRGSVTHNV